MSRHRLATSSCTSLRGPPRHTRSRTDDARWRRIPTGTAAALILQALAFAVMATLAHAEFPFLADPNRCDTSGLPVGCIALPNELSGGAGGCNGNKWKYASTSFCTTDPVVLASPQELNGVSGMSVDTAWRTQTGRSDVLIAVHDSGFKWNDSGAINDLRKKLHLNRGELPAPAPAGGCNAPPGGDPLDCNGDGVFNMPDYDGDPSLTDANGQRRHRPGRFDHALLGRRRRRRQRLRRRPRATQLCIYDGPRGLVLDGQIPPDRTCSGRPCWTESSSGFRFKANAATPDGITRVTLKQGLEPGRAKILVKGKGVNLHMPSLPMTQPVTVQLSSSNGVCWEAVYSAPVQKNEVDQFKDKSD